MRNEHLENNLIKGDFTKDLFKQYKKHLGATRYKLLLEGQKLVVPKKVNDLLSLGKYSLLSPILPPYKLSKKLKLDWMIKSIVLPAEYKQQVKALDRKH